MNGDQAADPKPVACRIKTPVTLHAMHWDGTVAGATVIIDWMLANDGTARYHEERARRLSINTDQGTEIALPGDWVMLGVTGRFFPQTEEEFAETYEIIPAAASLQAEDDPEAREEAEFLADAASLDTDFKENR